MSALSIIGLAIVMVGTSFLSGIFGMAGGMILMGVLLAVLPLPAAMALHAVTQMASNGWRGLLWRRHVRWRAVATFLSGCGVAFAVWVIWSYVPSKPVAFVLLGVSPFLVQLMPRRWHPDPENLAHGVIYGASCMGLMLLTGVSGPLIDTYFLGGRLERRQIVASKAMCQIAAHGAKLAYFSGLIDQAAGVSPGMAGMAISASMIGTWAARPVLEWLSDFQYRRWATYMITAIAIGYLLQGGYLLLGSGG